MPKGVEPPASFNLQPGMTAVELINDLRAGLAGPKAQGQTTIPLAVLDNYLAEMESAATSSAAATEATHGDARAKFEHEMEVWKIRTPLIFQSIIQSGQAALKAAILINGGAAVTLLAFIGNLLAKSASPDRGIGEAMLVFLGGALLGAFATAFTYLCQFLMEKNLKIAFGFNIAAIVVGFSSLIAFGCGGWVAFRAMPWK